MPQIDEARFLDLIYSAAIESDLWLPAMDQFALMTGGWSAFLTRVNVVNGTSTEISIYSDPVLTPQYQTHYATLNPFAEPPRFVGGRERWRGHVLTTDAWLPADELARTEFYNDYLRPQNINSAMMVHLTDQPHYFAQLVVNRLETCTQAELERGERLRPHIQRAFAMTQKLSDLGLKDRDVSAALETSPHALIVLDPTGFLRRMNLKAERLLAARAGLYLKHGFVSALDSATARQFDALIAAAGTGDIEHRQAGSMLLRSPAQSSPLSVTVAPVRSERMATVMNGRSVIVCITDLAVAAQISAPDLQRLFGVTAAEARVALAVANAASAREIAETLGLSFHTVRHHIQSLIDKTGVKSKAELTALLSRAAAGLAP